MTPLPPTILLNSDVNPGGFIFEIGSAVLGLIAVVVAGWFAIVRIRAWMQRSEDTSAPFTLDDLRRLHREGKLSEAEFQRAREAMIGAVRSQKRQQSERFGGASVGPQLLRSIEAERDGAERASRRGNESRSPSEATAQPSGSSHGKTVVRRPDILRRPPEGGPGKRAE